jgi:hypothetical protein
MQTQRFNSPSKSHKMPEMSCTAKQLSDSQKVLYQMESAIRKCTLYACVYISDKNVRIS